MVKNIQLKMLSLIVFVGMFFGLIRSYFGSYLNNDVYPYNTFLFAPSDRFNDLFNMINICLHNSPYITNYAFASNYFPLANTFFFLLSFIKNKMLLIAIFSGGAIYMYGTIIYKIFRKVWRIYFLDILIIFLFSYPIFFNVDRMNLEIYNFLLCLLWFYFKNTGKSWLAILFLSISISLKLYTGVFVVLYLKEKKYKEIIIVLLISILLSILSLVTFEGGFVANINAMLTALKNFTAAYSGSSGLGHNLSLFGLIKIFFYMIIGLLHISKETYSINSILPYYTIFSFLVFGGVVYIILTKRLQTWINLFMLTAVIILLPHVSFDYKLIFIYLPLISFLKETAKNKYDNVFTIGFAILLIPHNYLYIHKDISIAVIIYPVTIIIMLFLIFYKLSLNVTDQRRNSIV